MTYEEALKWYRSFEKFGVVPGLDRVKALCAGLGDPQKKLKCVHITGTNGKGSVCTETASVLAAAGYKTGLYTSPEVIDFRERMQINSEMITPSGLCRITEKVRCATEKLNGQGIFPTQFEVLTAAAFLWFYESRCDVVVLETGLGGRFDATNVIDDPLVCGIVSVSLDHTAVLGDTVEKIAFEKSGIIKNGVCAVAFAGIPDGARRVISDFADEKNCRLVFADEKEIFDLSPYDERESVIYKNTEIALPFFGYHQVCNAAVTVCVIETLRKKGFNIPDSALSLGISSSRIPARTEIISEKPFVMLDGCHNDASSAGLAGVLEKKLKGKRVLAVMGMMADKDCKKSAANLVGHFARVIAVTPSNPRSMKAADFAELIKSLGVESEAFDTPERGVDAAVEMLDGYDALVVCGSLYLAADIRAYLLKKFVK